MRGYYGDMAGVVVGEQTLLSFSSAPPASSCSPTLPAFVSEERGGETGFATNQQTQLQFDLNHQPNQANLATSFEPRRFSPVMIEKQPRAETIGMSQMPVDNFKLASAERLSLAMKLAKRDARKQTVVIDPSGTCPDCECCTECEHTWSDEERGHIESLEHRLKESDRKKTHPEPPRRPLAPINYNQRGVRESKVTKMAPKPPQVAIMEDIEKLKVDLEKQLKKMNRSTKFRVTNQVEDACIYREPLHWDEEEESEERQLQRQYEQMSRNARMMYDLSQQVCTSSPEVGTVVACR